MQQLTLWRVFDLTPVVDLHSRRQLTLRSKIASIVLCGWIVICLLICIAVKPKLFVAHQASRIKIGLARMCCQPKAAAFYRDQAGRDEKGETYEDRMVSLDMYVRCFGVLGQTRSPLP